MGANEYIRRDMPHVEGWLPPLTARIIATLAGHQTELGIKGAVGEIGVHHGKLWLLLDHLAAVDESRFAIDLFEYQDLNMDGSGRGNLDRFKKNRARYGANTGKVEILATSSLDVSAEQLHALVGEVRLLSIDGGHTAKCTLNDLNLADAVLCEAGIVVIDDVFNATWPGVMTGFAAYMESEYRRLVPFCIIPGKVVLCRPSNASSYARFAYERFGAYLIRAHDFFGYEVPIFIPPTTTLPFWIKSHVHGTPLEGVARQLYNRFLR